MASEGWHLFAPGVEITLGDGTPYLLKFPMKTVLLIEEKYGGLTAYMDSIQADEDDPWGPDRVKRVVDAMMYPLTPQLSRDELVDKLVFTDFVRYLQALTDAWYEAMPAGEDESTEEADPNASGSPDGSHGSSSTTSPPSAVVEAMSNSGT